MAKVYRFDKFKFMDPFQKEITYFISVADCLNVSKASEVLGIQQSGLSRAVTRLEEQLGTKLFYRKNTGLVLTPEGQHFLSAIKNAKMHWETAIADFSLETENPMGLMKIGTHPSFGQHFVPQIIAVLGQHFPGLEIEVQNLTSYETLRKVVDHELDFGLVSAPIKQPEIVMKKISEDYLAAYQWDSAKEPKALLFNPEMRLSNMLLRKYSHLKKILIKDYDLVAKTLCATSYVGLLPHSVAQNYKQLSQMSQKLLSAHISLIVHKEKLKSPVFRKISQMLYESCVR